MHPSARTTPLRGRTIRRGHDLVAGGHVPPLCGGRRRPTVPRWSYSLASRAQRRMLTSPGSPSTTTVAARVPSRSHRMQARSRSCERRWPTQGRRLTTSITWRLTALARASATRSNCTPSPRCSESVRLAAPCWLDQGPHRAHEHSGWHRQLRQGFPCRQAWRGAAHCPLPLAHEALRLGRVRRLTCALVPPMPKALTPAHWTPAPCSSWLGAVYLA